MPSRRLPVVLTTCLTLLAVRGVAGHQALAGPTLISFSDTHGVELGDLVVLGVWLVGLACCWQLWKRD